MAFLAKLFGGKNSEKIPTPSEAIQRLRDIEEMFTKKQEYLEKRVQQELLVARKNGTKNKKAALQALNRKKRFEKQLQQIDGTLTTIEFQREALENASTNTEVLKIMEFAAKALKNAHETVDIDKVHDIKDDVQEQQEIADEISEAISNPVGRLGQDVDENDLMKELESLEVEELEKQLLDVAGPSTENFQSPPTAEPAQPAANKAKNRDEDELKELLAACVFR